MVAQVAASSYGEGPRWGSPHWHQAAKPVRPSERAYPSPQAFASDETRRCDTTGTDEAAFLIADDRIAEDDRTGFLEPERNLVSALG